eukprot:5903928-Amphidinium_carterae.1
MEDYETITCIFNHKWRPFVVVLSAGRTSVCSAQFARLVTLRSKWLGPTGAMPIRTLWEQLLHEAFQEAELIRRPSLGISWLLLQAVTCTTWVKICVEEHSLFNPTKYSATITVSFRSEVHCK